MKNKEKEIEEMSREICSEYDCVIPCQSCGYYGYANCRDVKSAEKLYIAGYRKASEVAREIFKEIEKIVLAGIEKDESFREKMHTATDRSYFEGGANSQRKLLWLVRELKKKYESEGEGK